MKENVNLEIFKALVACFPLYLDKAKEYAGTKRIGIVGPQEPPNLISSNFSISNSILISNIPFYIFGNI